MSMPRKDQGWITFQASPEEREILETYCQQTQRSKTEVLRALVRQLAAQEGLNAAPVAPSIAPARTPELPSSRPLPFQVSARNLLPGRITNLQHDGINTEVTLEVAPQAEITSVITSTSAQRLGLMVGKWVFAMVKSSNVMIATGTELQSVADIAPN